MATYSPEDLNTSWDFSCPICFEDYDILSAQHAPKLLLCLHTFCFACTRRLRKADGTLECSLCRTVHSEVALGDLFDNPIIVQHLRKKCEAQDLELARRLDRELRKGGRTPNPPTQPQEVIDITKPPTPTRREDKGMGHREQEEEGRRLCTRLPGCQQQPQRQEEEDIFLNVDDIFIASNTREREMNTFEREMQGIQELVEEEGRQIEEEAEGLERALEVTIDIADDGNEDEEEEEVEEEWEGAGAEEEEYDQESEEDHQEEIQQHEEEEEEEEEEDIELDEDDDGIPCIQCSSDDDYDASLPFRPSSSEEYQEEEEDDERWHSASDDTGVRLCLEDDCSMDDGQLDSPDFVDWDNF